MSFTYPFPSKERELLAKSNLKTDHTIWNKPGFELKEALVNITQPIIEIGGPTVDGYYFLDQIPLPSKPVITNIFDNPLPYASNAKQLAEFVERKIDGRKMPYADNSIGAFLMLGMSLVEDLPHSNLKVSETEEERQRIELDRQYDIAELEMEQVAIGTLSPEKVQYAQRVFIYIEVLRAMGPNGLFFTDGSLTEIKILQNLGFELVAYLQKRIRANQGWSGVHYEFVVQKYL